MTTGSTIGHFLGWKGKRSVDRKHRTSLTLSTYLFKYIVNGVYGPMMKLADDAGIAYTKSYDLSTLTRLDEVVE